MAKTFALSLKGKFLFTGLFAFLFLSACATSFRSKEEILQAPRAVLLKMVGGLDSPGIRIILVDEQGFVNVEDRFPGKTTEEMMTRLNKPNCQQLFALVDSLEAMELKQEYQIGEDSKTYTLTIYHKGNPEKTTRFTSGIPHLIRQLVIQLEKIPDNE